MVFCSFKDIFLDFIGFYSYGLLKAFMSFYRSYRFIGSYTNHPDRPYLSPLLALVFFMGFTVFNGDLGF